MTRAQRCPACGGDEIIRFLELPDVPVYCNVLWPTVEEARGAPRGDIHLGFCRSCGLIYNYAFDPALTEYEPSYENSLHFSPRFQEYAEGLATRLSHRYGLSGKTIVEIGCGKGEFLELLCATAGANGVGFDPTYEPRHEMGDRIRVVRDLYSEAYADQPADLILSRHTLEHVARPREFLHTVRRAIGDRADVGVFFEVPNALFTLRDLGIWDIIYEHCSYFTAGSLRFVFEATGFTVEAVNPMFGEQFLALEARPDGTGPSDVGRPASSGIEALEDHVRSFGEVYRATVEAWGERLSVWRDRGERVAVWGAGSKGVTFLNAVPGGERLVPAVDVNPRKHGRHVPGTAQMVQGPASLTDDPPDIVLVMNAMYEEEIRQALASLRCEAQIIVVHSTPRSRVG